MTMSEAAQALAVDKLAGLLCQNVLNQTRLLGGKHLLMKVSKGKESFNKFKHRR